MLSELTRFSIIVIIFSVTFTATKILGWVILTFDNFKKLFSETEIHGQASLLVGSRDKLKTLYLYFHKSHNHQTWYGGNAG